MSKHSETGHITSRGPSGGDTRKAAKTEPDSSLGTYPAPVFGRRDGIGCKMVPFIYRCPNTGHRVQTLAAGEVSHDDTYQSVTCIMCDRIYLVNPATGKVLGEHDDG